PWPVRSPERSGFPLLRTSIRPGRERARTPRAGAARSHWPSGEQVRRVGGNPSADLDDDLVARVQRHLAHPPAPPDPVDVCNRRAPRPESAEAAGSERLAPDGEERAERRPCSVPEMDDTGGVVRPKRIPARSP